LGVTWDEACDRRMRSRRLFAQDAQTLKSEKQMQMLQVREDESLSFARVKARLYGTPQTATIVYSW